MKLDFSQWHPLDHWPGTRRCREHYGGWRRHLTIAWEFHRRDQVVGWFARWTTCLMGRHSWQVWRVVRRIDEFRQAGKVGAPGDYKPVCRYCHRRRTATEDEWW